jgi:nicotinamide riboside transporter PnuC
MLHRQQQMGDTYFLSEMCGIFQWSKTAFQNEVGSVRRPLPNDQACVHGKTTIGLLLIFFSFPPTFFSHNLVFCTIPSKD